jgi:hypothetical protein
MRIHLFSEPNLVRGRETEIGINETAFPLTTEGIFFPFTLSLSISLSFSKRGNRWYIAIAITELPDSTTLGLQSQARSQVKSS